MLSSKTINVKILAVGKACILYWETSAHDRTWLITTPHNLTVITGKIVKIKNTTDCEFACFQSHIKLQSVWKTEHEVKLSWLTAGLRSPRKLYSFNQWFMTTNHRVHKFPSDLNKLRSLTANSHCVRRSVGQYAGVSLRTN